MKQVGDLGSVRGERGGLGAVVKAAMLNVDMLAALFFFAVRSLRCWSLVVGGFKPCGAG